MSNNSELPVVGIILSSFTDAGPQVVYNSAKAQVSEDAALNLSIRIMTIIGEEISSELYGPLRRRQIGTSIDSLNEKYYHRRMIKRIVDSEDEATQLLNFYGLRHRDQH